MKRPIQKRRAADPVIAATTRNRKRSKGFVEGFAEF